MSTRIPVIVLNWNGRVHLERCLESLRARTIVRFRAVSPATQMERAHSLKAIIALGLS